jgi:hypothetical protein
MYMKRKGRRAKVERNKLEHERTLVQQRIVSVFCLFLLLPSPAGWWSAWHHFHGDDHWKTWSMVVIS